ncbi:hypothetical protein [Pseudarthrobacter sp. PS3-L1]|uniref:hypothetical protein n=1 Tax=Pseudarthrobacter sp. PS3-L1 TaxID=3046207 RepID=UPI0024B89AB7|nr:hypothetical protein [Pseudarthrobacter sp. PS3-L1]MDJ0321688.1 hypothetical protein [Pseudarthrobacter sp. PS3-L1]
MPKIPFVTMKNKIRSMYLASGAPISSRESHRLAQGIALTEFAALFAAATDEVYDRDCSDVTGESAVDNVLIEYLRKYGALSAPTLELVSA